MGSTNYQHALGKKYAALTGDLDRMDLQGGCLIYSLWPGYLDRDRTDLREWAKRKEIDFHIVHSSGHASSADLYRVAQAVAPQRLLPIHTVHPERYASLSANTVFPVSTNGTKLML